MRDSKREQRQTQDSAHPSETRAERNSDFVWSLSK